MKRLLLALSAIVAGVVVAGCAVGEPLETTNVTNARATLNGNVYSSFAGDTDVWWNYGPTTDYDNQTRHGQVAIADKDPHPVSTQLEGLAPETTHHFQMCAQDQEEGNPGRVVCSKDQTFTTQAAGTLSCDPTVLTLNSAENTGSTVCTASDGWLTTGTVEFTGANPDHFSASNGCDNVTLQPAASCTVTVTFTAGDVGTAFLADMNIPHDGANGTQTVRLVGFG